LRTCRLGKPRGRQANDNATAILKKGAAALHEWMPRSTFRQVATRQNVTTIGHLLDPQDLIVAKRAGAINSILEGQSAVGCKKKKLLTPHRRFMTRFENGRVARSTVGRPVNGSYRGLRSLYQGMEGGNAPDLARLIEIKRAL